MKRVVSVVEDSTCLIEFTNHVNTNRINESIVNSVLVDNHFEIFVDNRVGHLNCRNKEVVNVNNHHDNHQYNIRVHLCLNNYDHSDLFF